MSDNTFEYFMTDVLDEIQKRYDKSQKDMSEHQGDLFISGRALAYNEVYEIIKNRMDIYGITMESNTNNQNQ